MSAELSLSKRVEFHARATWLTFRRGQQTRDGASVVREYSNGWDQYKEFLRRATNFNDWMKIRGLEDAPGFYNVDGKVAYMAFDSASYYRLSLLDSIRKHFPTAKSVTEFGCGVGRNLLFLKSELPELECYGYELCQPGVDVATAAARRFGLDVQYSQLDYVKDKEEKYVFPPTDIAFTMFSLEQLPRNSDVAMKNILSRVTMGSIHIEPVPENYPWNLRGVLGRIEHRKVDYLSGFDSVVRTLNVPAVTVVRMTSAHNPLMYPSLYVLNKS